MSINCEIEIQIHSICSIELQNPERSVAIVAQ